MAKTRKKTATKKAAGKKAAGKKASAKKAGRKKITKKTPAAATANSGSGLGGGLPHPWPSDTQASDGPRPENHGQIPIEQIRRDGNHRDAVDPEAVDRLARSMQAVGQLSPVAVTAPPVGGSSEHSLVYGYHRVAAAEKLGWLYVEAEIYSGHMSPRDVERLRATENIDRQALTPLDEMRMVTAVLDSVDGDPDEAAALLGRSKGWVNQRAYLARLDDRVQHMVASGALTLGHARALAEVPDRTKQWEFARIAQMGYDPDAGGGRRMTVDELKRHIEEDRRDLKRVPWELTVPYGKLPACTECPANTANDPGLFGPRSDPKGPGRCTDGKCFAKKEAACERAKEKLVENLEKKELEPSAHSVKKHAGKLLKFSTAQRYAKKQLAQPKASGKGGKAPQAEPAEATASGRGASGSRGDPRLLALRNFQDAMHAWDRNAEHAVRDAIFRDGPTTLGALILAESRELSRRDANVRGATRSVRPYDQKPTEAPALPNELVLLIGECLGSGAGLGEHDLAAKLAAEHCNHESVAFVDMLLGDADEELMQQMAAALGVKLDPCPAWSDYDPDAPKQPGDEEGETDEHEPNAAAAGAGS